MIYIVDRWHQQDHKINMIMAEVRDKSKVMFDCCFELCQFFVEKIFTKKNEQETYALPLETSALRVPLKF